MAVSGEDQGCFWANLQDVRGAGSAVAPVSRNLMVTETQSCLWPQGCEHCTTKPANSTAAGVSLPAVFFLGRWGGGVGGSSFSTLLLCQNSSFQLHLDLGWVYDSGNKISLHLEQ